VVNVAMPSIATSLHASGASLQLVVGGYTITYAMLLITGARLGDRYGRRRTYLAGILVFTAASLACALAPDSQVLVGFRLVQGTVCDLGASRSAPTMKGTPRSRSRVRVAVGARSSVGEYLLPSRRRAARRPSRQCDRLDTGR